MARGAVSYADTLVSRPDWIRSTKTFHSLGVNTARLPSSPIFTVVSVISTSGQFSHSVQSVIFTCLSPFSGAVEAFNVAADRTGAFWQLAPRLQKGAQFLSRRREFVKGSVEVRYFTTDEMADVITRSPPGSADTEDFSNLDDGEAEASCLQDERQHVQGVLTVHTISGGGPRRRCDQTSRLVKP